LNQQADYDVFKQIVRLPYYLNVQFMRFFWKSKESVKSKITKSVKFPFEIDIFDLCTDELKSQLKEKRNLLREKEEKNEKEEKKQESEEHKKDSSLTNMTGVYELYAVLSHKGRSADSGHYVAWVKQDHNYWLCFDDEKVKAVDDEEIKKLQGLGGADWHIAYLCFYKTKEF